MDRNVGHNNCVLIISHSNYLIKSGGLEKFIRDHCKMLENSGIHYIHVFPVIEINKRTQKIGKEYAGISKDGVFLGIWEEHKIADAVSALINQNSLKLANCQIHHFHGWNTKILSVELKKLDAPIYFMVHDLESISPCMNRVGSQELCKKEVPIAGSSEICVNCVNCVNEYKQVVYAFEELKQLIKGVVTPSDNTRKYFVLAFPDFENLTHIREHLVFEMAHVDREVNHPIRIAYLGSTAAHKGYQEWKELVKKLPEDKYSFYYFGVADIDDDRIKKIKVDSRDPMLKGMTNRLKEFNIDIAFLWSKWPETYCYTYYEAIEAGCFVITNKLSGNICDEVRKYQNGMVLDTFTECVAFLNDDKKVLDSLEKFVADGKCPYGVRTNEGLIGEASDYDIGEHVHQIRSDRSIKISSKSLLLSLLYGKMRMN